MDYGYPSNQKWRNARYTLSPTPNVQRLTVWERPLCELNILSCLGSIVAVTEHQAKLRMRTILDTH